jgi:hypothetical protein
MARKIKTGGRRKGTPNRFTSAMRDAFRQAFDDLGGVPQLVEWAKENRTDFYKLAARLIPTEIEATGDGLGPLVVKIVHYGPSEKSSNTDGLRRGG